MFIDHNDLEKRNGWVPFGIKNLKFTKNRINFTIISAGTFILLTIAMYYL